MAEGRFEIGVIHVPALDELYAARRGEGAFCGGRPIRVSGCTAIAGATMASTIRSTIPRSIIAPTSRPYTPTAASTAAAAPWRCR